MNKEMTFEIFEKIKGAKEKKHAYQKKRRKKYAYQNQMFIQKTHDGNIKIFSREMCTLSELNSCMKNREKKKLFGFEII